MSIRKKKSVDFRLTLYRMMWYEKSKSEQRNASFPLEVMWPKWNKQQILGRKWCSQEPQAHVTSPFKTFLFFFFLFLPKLLAWGKRYIFAFQLCSPSPGSPWSGFFLLPCSGCSRTLTGCRRGWRWPWWRRWSDQRWAQSQTKPWRCSWTAASPPPSSSAAIPLPPQSPPCSGWWKQAGQCLRRPRQSGLRPVQC